MVAKKDRLLSMYCCLTLGSSCYTLHLLYTETLHYRHYSRDEDTDGKLQPLYTCDVHVQCIG